MAPIGVIDVRKTYGALEVVHGVSVDIADGDFVILVGPSGCGKSTLLRMIAGLESITSGIIKIGDRVVNTLAPKDRDIAMVFQNYALYPHKTVAENMGFALKLRGRPKAEIEQRVRRAADILDVATLLGRYPRQLSGGQRQRVAMGRAIVRSPQVFLFDEPIAFSPPPLSFDPARSGPRGRLCPSPRREERLRPVRRTHPRFPPRRKRASLAADSRPDSPRAPRSAPSASSKAPACPSS
jgi:ABC-type polar amino acid transport system ATPase subunit